MDYLLENFGPILFFILVVVGTGLLIFGETGKALWDLFLYRKNIPDKDQE